MDEYIEYLYVTGQLDAFLNDNKKEEDNYDENDDTENDDFSKSRKLTR